MAPPKGVHPGSMPALPKTSLLPKLAKPKSRCERACVCVCAYLCTRVCTRSVPGPGRRGKCCEAGFCSHLCLPPGAHVARSSEGTKLPPTQTTAHSTSYLLMVELAILVTRPNLVPSFPYTFISDRGGVRSWHFWEIWKSVYHSFRRKQTD